GLVNYMILNRCQRPDGQPWTKDDCVWLLKEWFNIYKGVKRFQEACIREAQETGLARESISGRMIYLPQVWLPDSKKWARESAERMSYVMHTQGGAAALIKKCMAVIWKEIKGMLGMQVEPLLWVHDENLFEVRDDKSVRERVDEIVSGA